MIWWLTSWLALAGPAISLVAEVDPDLRTVRGTLMATGAPADWTWVDPLETLPRPTHELDGLRTWPGGPSDGSVHFEPDGDGGWRFEAVLPRRWGDVGATGFGLFANGAFYPQPLDGDGALPLVDWSVQIHLPTGAVGAVGDRAGEGELRWRGEGERVSLAVLPRGELTLIEQPGWTVTLLSPRRPRPAVVKALESQLDLAAIEGVRREGVVVLAPLRRRLARAGDGLVYLSDRAWAVFPWFRRLHHRTAISAIWQATEPRADPFERSLVAAALGRVHDHRLERRQAIDLLGLTRWLPAVDAALYNQEMAFQAALFDRAHLTDRVKDDLSERFAPITPGRVVVAQLSDRIGLDALVVLAGRLALGASVAEALSDLGLPEDWLPAWRARYPTQDYVLELEGTTLTVVRQAGEDALPETVIVDVDGERLHWHTPVGAGRSTWELEEAPKRVSLDPDRHLDQTTRIGDSKPSRLRWTLSGAITGINFSEGFASAYAVLTVRRSADTFNRWRIWAFTNQRERMRVRLAYTRYAGPIVRGVTRQHAVTLGLEGAWLNPRFAPLAGAPLSAGWSLSWAWDNRVYSLFPLRGAALSVRVASGGVPSTGDTYLSLTGSVTALAPLHPRHVLAVSIRGGGAWTELPQRRLSFGGASGVRGIPDDVVQTELQAVGTLEYRIAPVREAAINLLWLTWIRELHLTFGLDAGTGRVDDEAIQAVGASAGVGVIVDNFGLSPGAVDVTFAVPLGTRGFDLPVEGLPFELYLTWGLMF